MNKILFVGGINIGSIPRGGQEFKNQIVLEYLQNNYRVDIVDTAGWRNRLWVILFLALKLFFKKYDVVLLSLTTESSFKVLKYFSWRTRNRNNFVYLVVGGGIVKFLSSNRRRIKYYKNINSIVVQGKTIHEGLIRLGLKNKLFVVPNFKHIDREWISYSIPEPEMRKFLFLSSVMPEKGVDLILESIKNLLAIRHIDTFVVDFYGPFENGYERVFFNEIQYLGGRVSYKGVIDLKSNPSEGYRVLRSYDCMLFPTRYINEGFPGVIIDAFIAGLPVIASDWNMNKELIQDGINGLIINPSSAVNLAEAMEYIINNPANLLEMKRACNHLATNFDSVLHLKELDKIILQ